MEKCRYTAAQFCLTVCSPSLVCGREMLAGHDLTPHILCGNSSPVPPEAALQPHHRNSSMSLCCSWQFFLLFRHQKALTLAEIFLIQHLCCVKNHMLPVNPNIPAWPPVELRNGAAIIAGCCCSRGSTWQHFSSSSSRKKDMCMYIICTCLYIRPQIPCKSLLFSCLGWDLCKIMAVFVMTRTLRAPATPSSLCFFLLSLFFFNLHRFVTFFLLFFNTKNKDCGFLETWQMGEQQQQRLRVVLLMLELPWES